MKIGQDLTLLHFLSLFEKKCIKFILLRYVHKGKKQFECDICDLLSNTSLKETFYLISCAKKYFECDLCGYIFQKFDLIVILLVIINKKYSNVTKTIMYK